MIYDANIFWTQAQNSDIDYDRMSVYEHFHQNLQYAWKQAYIICLFICFFYLSKLFITLSLSQNIEEPAFFILIFAMGLHDVMSILHYLILGILIQFWNTQELNVIDHQINILSLNSSITQIIIMEIINYYKPDNGLLLIDYLEQKFFVLNCITIKILYYCISTYTFVAVLLINKEIPSLIIMYMVFMIIHLFIPIIMCFVWPFVMLWFMILRSDNQQRNRNIIIKLFDQLQNIKLKKLKEQRPSLLQNDCPICYQEINESHSVIQLPCHKQHYFHADCCRQWIGRDPRCPMCRSTLDQPQQITLLEFI